MQLPPPSLHSCMSAEHLPHHLPIRQRLSEHAVGCHASLSSHPPPAPAPLRSPRVPCLYSRANLKASSCQPAVIPKLGYNNSTSKQPAPVNFSGTGVFRRLAHFLSILACGLNTRLSHNSSSWCCTCALLSFLLRLLSQRGGQFQRNELVESSGECGAGSACVRRFHTGGRVFELSAHPANNNTSWDIS